MDSKVADAPHQDNHSQKTYRVSNRGHYPTWGYAGRNSTGAISTLPTVSELATICFDSKMRLVNQTSTMIGLARV